MTKRILYIFLSLLLLLSYVSSTTGFDNDPNWVDPKDKSKGQKEYTREKAIQGEYYGGHDTITSEATLLKKAVHSGDTKFQEWANDKSVLPSLRIGAHDEDSTKVKIDVPMALPDPTLNITYPIEIALDEPPIGSTGWGGWFDHFYNPDTGKGLKGGLGGRPATEKAKDYAVEIKKLLCKSQKVFLTDAEKKTLYELFGKTGHLLQDMASPSHVHDDIHIFQKPYEAYVNNHWDKIVKSSVFKEAVTAEKYLNGNYRLGSALDPERFMVSLAKITSKYPSEEQLLSDETVTKSANELVPEAIKHTAGYIDSIYDAAIGASGGSDICKPAPPEITSPGGDHPDDRFDVSDEFYWEKEFKFTGADLTDLFMRTAIKKGKIGVWYKKRFMEIFAAGRTIYKDEPQDVKDAIEAEFQAMGKKLEERAGMAESDWKGAPDDLAKKMFAMAKTPQEKAFAYGWMIHVASDSIGNEWVNELAGGEYDPENEVIVSAHRDIEMSIDKKNYLEQRWRGR